MIAEDVKISTSLELNIQIKILCNASRFKLILLNVYRLFISLVCMSVTFHPLMDILIVMVMMFSDSFGA